MLITALKERVSSAAGSLEFFPFDLEPAQQDQLVTVRYYDSILITNPNVINYQLHVIEITVFRYIQLKVSITYLLTREN